MGGKGDKSELKIKNSIHFDLERGKRYEQTGKVVF